MPERLTLDEIIEKYPDQWVALNEVRFEGGAALGAIESAIVICGMKDSEYSKTRCNFMLSGKDYVYIRTADPDARNGVCICAD